MQRGEPIQEHSSHRGDCAYCTDPFYGHHFPHMAPARAADEPAPAPLTAAERQSVYSSHALNTRAFPSLGQLTGRCVGCSAPWPCLHARYEATVRDLEERLSTEQAAGRLALGLLSESRRREGLATAVADATWEMLNTSRDTPERSAAFKKVCLATAARNDDIEARGGTVKRDWGESGG